MPDLLDRFLGHDAWTTAQLLLLCRTMTDEQLDRGFDLGHRTLRATFVHIIGNMETWSNLMLASLTPGQKSARPMGASVEQLITRLSCAAADLATIARTVAARDGWNELWLDTLDSPPKAKTYGGAIAHLITHSMHHRAHLLYMLRRSGVKNLPEGDVFSWEKTLK